MKRILTLLALIVFSFPLFGQDNNETAELMLTLIKRSNCEPAFYTKFYKVKAWSAKLSKPIPNNNDT